MYIWVVGWSKALRFIMDFEADSVNKLECGNSTVEGPYCDPFRGHY